MTISADNLHMRVTLWCVVQETPEGFYVQPKTQPELDLPRVGPFATRMEAIRKADEFVRRAEEGTKRAEA